MMMMSQFISCNTPYVLCLFDQLNSSCIDSCPNCLLPHPSLNDEPRKRNRRVKKQKARARIPVSSPESSSDDEAYRAALTVASERRRNRPRIFGQRGSGSLSPTTKGDIRSSRTGENVHSVVRGLLQKNDSVLVGWIFRFHILILGAVHCSCLPKRQKKSIQYKSGRDRAFLVTATTSWNRLFYDIDNS